MKWEPMTEFKNVVIFSGEGDCGTYHRHIGRPTLQAIRQRLNRERCHGDRWAKAFAPAGAEYEPHAYIEVESGEMRTIRPKDLD